MLENLLRGGRVKGVKDGEDSLPGLLTDCDFGRENAEINICIGP